MRTAASAVLLALDILVKLSAVLSLCWEKLSAPAAISAVLLAQSTWAKASSSVSIVAETAVRLPFCQTAEWSHVGTAMTSSTKTERIVSRRWLPFFVAEWKEFRLMFLK